MTEEEAKTKWCPFARIAGGTSGDPRTAIVEGAAINRVALPGQIAALPVAAMCLASGCMAWREHPKQRFQRQTGTFQEKPEGDGWFIVPATSIGGQYVGEHWARDVELPPQGGHCGLAGQP